ncbi:MAG: hypothetical protein WDO56_26480 [Gammaproteobacteria bacterium]
MKKLLQIAAVAALACGTEATAACTRADLASTVDNYFKALAAHDPKAVPLASTVRFTENGEPIEPGEGFWKTAGQRVFARSALDTETCGTVTQAVIEENGRQILFGVRLKLDGGARISEIEHVIAREKEFAFKPQGVLDTRDQDWEGVLPPEQRTSRAAMIAAANDYYDMFVAVPEVSVPFARPCERWENGTKTTKGDCSPKGLVLVHPERRVPVVDREAGIAVAFVYFNGALPDFHMFKFRSGHIELAQAVIGPRGAKSTGWPDDKSLSRRVPPPGEKASPPAGPPPGATPAAGSPPDKANLALRLGVNVAMYAISH